MASRNDHYTFLLPGPVQMGLDYTVPVAVQVLKRIVATVSPRFVITAPDRLILSSLHPSCSSRAGRVLSITCYNVHDPTKTARDHSMVKNKKDRLF
jgi:hypothetical protein